LALGEVANWHLRFLPRGTKAGEREKGEAEEKTGKIKGEQLEKNLQDKGLVKKKQGTIEFRGDVA